MAKERKPSAVARMKERIAELEQRCVALRQRSDEKDDDLRSARKRVDELSRELEAAQINNRHLQREVGRLEGYKQRVERTDDLARNVPPIEHVGGNGNMAVDLSSYPRSNRPDVGWSGRQR